MKKEKGVTLISLIIYVLLMTFVVAAVTAITASFNNNLSQVDQNSKSSVAFSKFNMYFLNDIKAKKAKIVSNTTDSIEISYFDNNGVSQTASYTFKSGGLYRNKVKICDNVKNVNITADETSGVITVYIQIKNYQKTTTYKIEPKVDLNDSNAT